MTPASPLSTYWLVVETCGPSLLCSAAHRCYYTRKEAKADDRQTQVPGKLSQVAYADNSQQKEKVEAFTDVAARHLEQIVLLELLEYASLQLHKLSRQHTHSRNTYVSVITA